MSGNKVNSKQKDGFKQKELDGTKVKAAIDKVRDKIKTEKNVMLKKYIQ